MRYLKTLFVPYYRVLAANSEITVRYHGTDAILSRGEDPNIIKIITSKSCPRNVTKIKLLYVDMAGDIVDKHNRISIYFHHNLKYIEYHNAFRKYFNTESDVPGIIGISFTPKEYEYYKTFSAQELLYLNIDRFESRIYKWFKDGVLHRENDKPALIQYGYHLSIMGNYINYQHKIWARNGLYSRPNSDKPTIICCASDFMYVAWHKNDILHRANGPAYMNSRGVCVNYINGAPVNLKSARQFSPEEVQEFILDYFNKS